MGNLQEGGLQDTKVVTSQGEVPMAELGIGHSHRVARPGFFVFHEELYANSRTAPELRPEVFSPPSSRNPLTASNI